MNLDKRGEQMSEIPELIETVEDKVILGEVVGSEVQPNLLALVSHTIV